MATPVVTNRARWALVLLIGTALTVGCGLLAAWKAEDGRGLLTFIVFAVTCAPVFYGGSWALIPDQTSHDPVTHVADTVEHAWLQRAATGAFTDLITSLGLASGLHYMLSTPAVPTVIFLLVGMASFGLRYRAASREAT